MQAALSMDIGHSGRVLAKGPKCWQKEPSFGSRAKEIWRDTNLPAPGVRVALLEQVIFSKKEFNG